MRRIDITGQRFGYLVAIKIIGKGREGRPLWLCQCDCGAQKAVVSKDLLRGDTVSCGCWRRGHAKRYDLGRNWVKHGAARAGQISSEFKSWWAMIKRCTKPYTKDFHNYGGRGISICERWLTFENFFADMGPRPKGHSIERIDNNGNYEPSNCKWIPLSEQAKNRRERIRNSKGQFTSMTRQL